MKCMYNNYSDVSGIQIPTVFSVTKRNLPLTFKSKNRLLVKFSFFNNGL